jgi:hypothetical protein
MGPLEVTDQRLQAGLAEQLTATQQAGLVARRQMRQASQSASQGMCGFLPQLDAQVLRGALEQRELLSRIERQKLHAYGEAPERCGVERLEAVGGAQEDAAAPNPAC